MPTSLSVDSIADGLFCTTCQEEQLKSHETRFRAVSAELQELRSTPQDRKTKNRDQEEHKLREEYLDFEVKKNHILLYIYPSLKIFFSFLRQYCIYSSQDLAMTKLKRFIPFIPP